jgi:integrase
MVGFANWCVRTGRLTANPFEDVPRANAKADQRRKRRALSEPELNRLLNVARRRPLAEFGRQAIQKNAVDVARKRDTWKAAPLTYEGLEAAVTLARERLAKNPKFAAKLTQRGRERALVYRTLVLTGLRRGELASLTIGSLELDAPTPFAVLEAGDEKNRQGSDIPLREDLVAELREWIADKRAEFAGTDEEFSLQPLFSVPASLLRVLDRDLKVAGILKTDERGRTVDVHAMRMTLATMLNKAGVAPRTAQEIMRHSDIRLTMATYTDAKLLNISGALDELPSLSPDKPSEPRGEAMRATGTDAERPSPFAPPFPPTAGHQGETVSIPVILAAEFGSKPARDEGTANPSKPSKKALSEGFSDKAERVGMTRFELATSASRTHETCHGRTLETRDIEPAEDVACTAACTSLTTKTPSNSGGEHASDFTAAMLMIAHLPLTDDEKAEAIRKLLAR